MRNIKTMIAILLIPKEPAQQFVEGRSPCMYALK